MSEVSTGYFLKAPRVKNPPSYPIPAYGGCPWVSPSLDGDHPTPLVAFVVTLPFPILIAHLHLSGPLSLPCNHLDN